MIESQRTAEDERFACMASTHATVIAKEEEEKKRQELKKGKAEAIPPAIQERDTGQPGERRDRTHGGAVGPEGQQSGYKLQTSHCAASIQTLHPGSLIICRASTSASCFRELGAKHQRESESVRVK